MLSLGCKASIKAVIFLATQKVGAPRPGMAEIAHHIGENVHTVGKLLQKLVKADIIKSAKGPSGGFYITEGQLDARLLVIVQAIDGPDIFNQCGLGLSKCSATTPCPLHFQYKPIRDGFENICKLNTIRDACAPVMDGLAYLVNR